MTERTEARMSGTTKSIRIKSAPHRLREAWRRRRRHGPTDAGRSTSETTVHCQRSQGHGDNHRGDVRNADAACGRGLDSHCDAERDRDDVETGRVEAPDSKYDDQNERDGRQEYDGSSGHGVLVRRRRCQRPPRIAPAPKPICANMDLNVGIRECPASPSPMNRTFSVMLAVKTFVESEIADGVDHSGTEGRQHHGE